MEDLPLVHPDLEAHLDDGNGELPSAVRGHLAVCDRCAGDFEALIELREAARQLPSVIQPRTNLWPAIADRIGRMQEISAPDAPVVPLRPRGARRAARWEWLAAAAIILIVLSAGMTTYLLNRWGTQVPSLAAVDVQPGLQPPMGLAAFASAETEYRNTVESLAAELEARRDALSPVTIETVEQNLAIIDKAIAEARRALAEDPTSLDLPLLLSGVYRQKVELLQKAVDLSARS